jgi:hypothetical protein
MSADAAAWTGAPQHPLLPVLVSPQQPCATAAPWTKPPLGCGTALVPCSLVVFDAVCSLMVSMGVLLGFMYRFSLMETELCEKGRNAQRRLATLSAKMEEPLSAPSEACGDAQVC